MNKAIIIGRIASDLELRATTTGKSICDFRIATNRPASKDGEKVADFINCRVWNKPAENLVKYQTKGSLIAVVGRTQVDTYQDKEGNTRYINYVLVEELEYLERKKDNNEKENKNSDDPYKEFGQTIEIDDSELPF